MPGWGGIWSMSRCRGRKPASRSVASTCAMPAAGIDALPGTALGPAMAGGQPKPAAPLPSLPHSPIPTKITGASHSRPWVQRCRETAAWLLHGAESSLSFAACSPSPTFSHLHEPLREVQAQARVGRPAAAHPSPDVTMEVGTVRMRVYVWACECARMLRARVRVGVHMCARACTQTRTRVQGGWMVWSLRHHALSHDWLASSCTMPSRHAAAGGGQSWRHGSGRQTSQAVQARPQPGSSAWRGGGPAAQEATGQAAA